RARGRGSDRERRGVQPALRVSPAAGGAPGRFLSRRGAPIRSEAAGAAWRHRLLPRGRRGLHRARARPLPRGPARRPRGRAAGPVGRADRARGRRRVRADRAPGRAAPSDVARPAVVRGAHVGSGDGRARVVAAEVPARGYGARAEGERAANPPLNEGATLEAQAGRFHVVLDPASGAIRSLTTGDGKERVRPAGWSGLNQLVYVRGGAHSALWTDAAPDALRAAADLTLSQAELDSARRERLPGIGVRLLVERRLQGCSSVATVVTLYDELPWLDIENRITKPATLEKEALYVAFP